ncbi:20623_t:CDS:2, partial [Entrophospora sp. SA101]
ETPYRKSPGYLRDTTLENATNSPEISPPKSTLRDLERAITEITSKKLALEFQREKALVAKAKEDQMSGFFGGISRSLSGGGQSTTKEDNSETKPVVQMVEAKTSIKMATGPPVPDPSTIVKENKEKKKEAVASISSSKNSKPQSTAGDNVGGTSTSTPVTAGTSTNPPENPFCIIKDSKVEDDSTILIIEETPYRKSPGYLRDTTLENATNSPEISPPKSTLRDLERAITEITSKKLALEFQREKALVAKAKEDQMSGFFGGISRSLSGGGQSTTKEDNSETKPVVQMVEAKTSIKMATGPPVPDPSTIVKENKEKKKEAVASISSSKNSKPQSTAGDNVGGTSTSTPVTAGTSTNPPENPFCIIKDCKNKKQKGAQFCKSCLDKQLAARKCVTKDCTNVKLGGSKFCAKCASKNDTVYCKEGTCVEQAQMGELYCAAHTCTTNGCMEPKDGNSHLCRGCYQKVEEQRKQRCGSERDIGDRYCQKCKCQIDSCENKREDYKAFCKECQEDPRRCITEDCPRAKLTKIRQCEEQGCENLVLEDAMYCWPCEKNLPECIREECRSSVQHRSNQYCDVCFNSMSPPNTPTPTVSQTVSMGQGAGSQPNLAGTSIQGIGRTATSPPRQPPNWQTTIVQPPGGQQ